MQIECLENSSEQRGIVIMKCLHPKNAIGNDLIRIYDSLDKKIKKEIDVLGPFCPGCPIICKFKKHKDWDFNSNRHKCFMNLDLNRFKGKFIKK